MPTTRRQKALAALETPPVSELSTPAPPSDPIEVNDTPPRLCSSRHASKTPSEEPALQEASKQARNAKNPRWRPWQDRALAEQVLIHRPFLEARGAPIQAAWDRLAQELRHESSRSGTAIVRSGAACRARFKLLVDAHKKNEARALQLTGTNEEVNEHIMTLTSIVALMNDHETEREQRSSAAKTRVATETAAALQLRNAAMKGAVRRETLIDVSKLDGSTLRERQGQRNRKKRAHSSASDDTSDKENCNERPRKRRGKNVLFDVLASRAESDAKALEQARAHDEQRQLQLVDRLERMADGIATLTEITRQKIEQDKQQQSDMLKMVLDRVLKK